MSLFARKGAAGAAERGEKHAARGAGERAGAPRVVVSFPTTTEAMHLQAVAGEAGLGGRLIPIPRALSAGCGLAWSEPIETEALLRSVLAEQGVEFEQVCVLEL